MSNSLDPDQARHFVVPDLGPNCLPRLSADDNSRQRVNSLSASENLCRLMIIFANSVDPDEEMKFTQNYPAFKELNMPRTFCRA